MKKMNNAGRGIIIGLLMMIFLAASVSAFGIAPSRELIPYDTSTHTYTLRVINNGNQPIKAAVYLNGELKDYAAVDTALINVGANSEKSFTYTITLPEGLSPGQKELDVMVAQIPEEPANGASTVNAGLIAVHQLLVDVPYPGQFADGTLYVSSSKKGDPLTFTLSLMNKGQLDIHASVDIVIKGPTNEQITRFSLGETDLKSGTQGKIEKQIVNDLNPGEYVAEAIVQYGTETRRLTKNFYSGDMIVDINSVQAKDFRLGSVAKFDIGIENKWNQPLDVYADMSVLDESGNQIDTYKTGTTRINALASEILNGYWDTAGMDVGRYTVRVVLNYAGRTTEKVTDIVVGIDSITVSGGLSGNAVTEQPKSTADSKFNIVIILLVILVIINVGWFTYFKFLRKPPAGPT